MESLTRLCAAFGGISVVRGELFASQGVVAVPRERIERLGTRLSHLCYLLCAAEFLPTTLKHYLEARNFAYECISGLKKYG